MLWYPKEFVLQSVFAIGAVHDDFQKITTFRGFVSYEEIAGELGLIRCRIKGTSISHSKVSSAHRQL